MRVLILLLLHRKQRVLCCEHRLPACNHFVPRGSHFAKRALHLLANLRDHVLVRLDRLLPLTIPMQCFELKP